MAEPIDITELLKERKWQSNSDKEYVQRHIRTSELTVLISDTTTNLILTLPGLSLEGRLPLLALSQFTTATLHFIKEISAALSASPVVREPEQMKILIAEAMHKDLMQMCSELPQKMRSFVLEKI